MRSLVTFVGLGTLAAVSFGCGRKPARDPEIDANGPVVNPLAPGVQAGHKKGAPVSGGMYTAPPGMQTGIPK
jgi:hypothetical protein